jgi:hypothetical protein
MALMHFGLDGSVDNDLHKATDCLVSTVDEACAFGVLVGQQVFASFIFFTKRKNLCLLQGSI